MSTPQHTPAPWKTRKGFGHGEIDIFRPTKDVKKPFVPTKLAIVRINDDSKDTIAESKANARLIAAAPDLLEVLQELEESSSYWSDYDVPVGIVDRIKAAITRATGKES